MNTLSLEDLVSKLASLQKDLTAGGYAKRLMMTDDIKDYRKLRERATAEKNFFFYGAALPDRLQDMLDGLVREHKAALLELLTQDNLTEHQLAVEFHQDQDAYLFTLLGNGMGFYVSARTTKARVKRPAPKAVAKVVDEAPAKPAVTMADLVKSLPPKVEKPKATVTPVKASKPHKKQPPVKRRQFTEIRVIKS